MLDAPNRDRQAERRAATRREIIDAAWALARERGLTEWTLRDVAQRIGMRAPSLYFHFASKNAIYDAMFGEAWTAFEEEVQSREPLPDHPRTRVQTFSLQFFDFAVADLARNQLMNKNVVPGFEPSAESFAPSVRVVAHHVAVLTDMGVTDRGDVEILFSVIGGLVDQQFANDPGGDSRRLLVARAVNMWADAVGLPKE